MAKFKVGDKVRIVGPSQTGGDVRRGEVVTVSSVQTDHRGNTWYNVTVKPRCMLSTYAATSLEAVVEPPATPAPYIVMLRGKDGRLAPSSHPAEHTYRQEARDEAARLAKRHGQRFEIWQQVAVVEPPPPKHKFSVGQFVRAVRDTRSIGGTCSVVAGQVVQVKWLGNDTFNSTPLQGSRLPGFLGADFEAVN